MGIKTADDVLEFWFLAKSHPQYGEKRAEWFTKSDTFDQQIRDLFLETYEAAVNGDLLPWCDSVDGCIALIILLDQFPRNMFRNSPKAFASDAKARAIANHMIEKGFFHKAPHHYKFFAALPFEHSEALEDQNYSVSLYTEMDDKDGLEYAIKHQVIIERFGRFPHRNKILGRPTTDEEEIFLLEPGSSF